MLQDWTRLAAPALIVAIGAVLVTAAVTDVAARRVPNVLPALLAVAGLGLRAASGTLAGGAAAAAGVFALGFLCWRRGWMGGGDVKLLAAATLTVPPLLAPGMLLAVALAGGALGVLYLLLSVVLPPIRAGVAFAGNDAGRRARSGVPARWLARAVRRERRRIERRGPLPYAAAIAAGTLFVLIGH